jgi:hypothetical protein
MTAPVAQQGSASCNAVAVGSKGPRCLVAGVASCWGCVNSGVWLSAHSHRLILCAFSACMQSRTGSIVLAASGTVAQGCSTACRCITWQRGCMKKGLWCLCNSLAADKACRGCGALGFCCFLGGECMAARHLSQGCCCCCCCCACPGYFASFQDKAQRVCLDLLD